MSDSLSGVLVSALALVAFFFFMMIFLWRRRKDFSELKPFFQGKFDLFGGLGFDVNGRHFRIYGGGMPTVSGFAGRHIVLSAIMNGRTPEIVFGNPRLVRYVLRIPSIGADQGDPASNVFVAAETAEYEGKIREVVFDASATEAIQVLFAKDWSRIEIRSQLVVDGFRLRACSILYYYGLPTDALHDPKLVQSAIVQILALLDRIGIA